MNKNFDEIIAKANTLTEALPYIHAYTGKYIVVKYGGNAMHNPDIIKTILQDIAALKIVGVQPILVHGGGPEINAMLARLGIETKTANGLRITDKETMEVVQMVLGGKINKNIVAQLGTMGVRALGICGKDGNLIEVRKMPDKDGIDYGYVGEITKINADLLIRLCNAGYVPVIASIGVDANGESYNINADTAAGEIGAAVGAEKLVYLTDIDGILADSADKSSLLTEVKFSDVKKMIKSGAISGGMIPKVESCISAINRGIRHVNIINGMIPHSILVELFTVDGIGTLITAD